MSCTNNTAASLIVIPARTPVRWKQPLIVTAIVAILEAFQEALELRRAAHRTNPISDE
jgi:hypothetical protein